MIRKKGPLQSSSHWSLRQSLGPGACQDLSHGPRCLTRLTRVTEGALAGSALSTALDSLHEDLLAYVYKAPRPRSRILCF